MNISSLDVRSMLPENLNHFFRYQGSLTTPPCYESILWTVFDTPITLSHNQVRHLGKAESSASEGWKTRIQSRNFIHVCFRRSGSWRAP